MSLGEQRLQEALQQSERAIELLNDAAQRDDSKELYAKVFEVAEKVVQDSAPDMRQYVLSNYKSTGLGKWTNHDKGLMEREIMQGVVTLRKRTTGPASERNWYIRFNLRPDAKHYTNRNGKVRNIYVVAHAQSFGAVHVSGMGKRASFSSNTGNRLADADVLRGAKIRRTIKKAALKARTKNEDQRLASRMSYRQRAEFLRETRGREADAGHGPGSGVWGGERFDVEGGGSITVIPPRPWLLLTTMQRAKIFARVYRAINQAIEKGVVYA